MNEGKGTCVSLLCFSLDWNWHHPQLFLMQEHFRYLLAIFHCIIFCPRMSEMSLWLSHGKEQQGNVGAREWLFPCSLCLDAGACIFPHPHFTTYTFFYAREDCPFILGKELPPAKKVFRGKESILIYNKLFQKCFTWPLNATFQHLPLSPAVVFIFLGPGLQITATRNTYW